MAIDAGFINKSGLEFKDISSEVSRSYHFSAQIVTIADPLWLHVSDSGGHRIFDASGISHYIPSGWVHLEWTVKPGSPNFDF